MTMTSISLNRNYLSIEEYIEKYGAKFTHILVSAKNKAGYDSIHSYPFNEPSDIIHAITRFQPYVISNVTLLSSDVVEVSGCNTTTPVIQSKGGKLVYVNIYVTQNLRRLNSLFKMKDIDLLEYFNATKEKV